jgi:alpha-galactosidase
MQQASSTTTLRIFISCCSIHLIWLLLFGDTTVVALDNGLGRTPPMGWNTWNQFGCDIDETLIRDSARALVATGLADLGYRYVNLDDCWMSHNRTTDLKYQGDPDRFPSGMKALGDYLHSLGLLFGIYTSAGTYTCEGFPGSLGNEELDAQTFAEWGVDYLKYDNCYNKGIPGIERYATMRNALNQTGRKIFYSLCQWGREESYQWAPAVGNSWRATGDIRPTFESIQHNFWTSMLAAVPRSRPGAWADADILEIGNGNLTIDEQKTHFGLWILIKTPLLLGMDLQNVDPKSIEIVKNRELISIHQDNHFPPASCYVHCFGKSTSQKTGRQYSVFATSNSFDTIVMVVNWSDSILDVQVPLHKIGVVPMPEQEVICKDLWTGSIIGILKFHDDLPVPTLAAHGNAIFRLTSTTAVAAQAQFTVQ